MRREGDNDKDNSDAKFAMMIMMTTIVLVVPSGQPQYVSTKECVLKVISLSMKTEKKMKIEIKQ